MPYLFSPTNLKWIHVFYLPFFFLLLIYNEECLFGCERLHITIDAKIFTFLNYLRICTLIFKKFPYDINDLIFYGLSTYRSLFKTKIYSGLLEVAYTVFSSPHLHLNTEQTWHCLALQIKWEPMFSVWFDYRPSWHHKFIKKIYFFFIYKSKMVIYIRSYPQVLVLPDNSVLPATDLVHEGITPVPQQGFSSLVFLRTNEHSWRLNPYLVQWDRPSSISMYDTSVVMTCVLVAYQCLCLRK